ncbi:peptide MFS transporter [bacterium]|nr:peptide MFS transporter [bacterium]
MKNIFEGQPKGLFLLFAVEMWERFSYYGMRALLVLYLIQYLFKSLDTTTATQYAGNIYGWYTGLVYLTPLAGGYIADRFLGQRKCISIGAVLMTIGLFLLSASDFSMFVNYNFIIFTLGLVLMVISNGFIKSNISTIVGMLYGDDKQGRDTGFTIFYMGINLGAFLSPLICGTLASLYGFKYGFTAAGCGILIGYFIYKLGENKLLGEHGLAPYKENLTQINEERELRLREKRKIWALFVLMAFSIIFWSCYEQAGCSMALFAENETNRLIPFLGKSFMVPSQYFQSLNPLFIITFAPIMSAIWAFLHSKKAEPNSVVKFNFALFFIACSFLTMSIAAYFAKTNPVSPLWLIIAFWIATIAELCISPIGLSLVTKLAPAKFASLLMGCWFLSSFVGNLSAGIFAGFYEKIPHNIFYLALATTALFVALILFLLTPLLKKWIGKY